MEDALKLAKMAPSHYINIILQTKKSKSKWKIGFNLEIFDLLEFQAPFTQSPRLMESLDLCIQGLSLFSIFQSIIKLLLALRIVADGKKLFFALSICGNLGLQLFDLSFHAGCTLVNLLDLIFPSFSFLR